MVAVLQQFYNDACVDEKLMQPHSLLCAKGVEMLCRVGDEYSRKNPFANEGGGGRKCFVEQVMSNSRKNNPAMVKQK